MHVILLCSRESGTSHPGDLSLLRDFWTNRMTVCAQTSESPVTDLLHCLECGAVVGLLWPFEGRWAIWAGNVLAHRASVFCVHCGEKRTFVGAKIAPKCFEP